VNSFAPKRRLSDRSAHFLALAFVAISIGLIPWTLFLAATLPSRHVQSDFYDVGWAGFDVALATMIALTGIGLLRRAAWVQATAASAATLLVCDAWFDVLGSSHHGERLVSLLLAVFAELPTAGVCALIALDAEAAADQAERYVRLRLPDAEAQEALNKP
jgi:hypothetical protein